MKPIVTEEQIARQTPEAQAIMRTLLAKIVKMEAEISVSKSNRKSIRCKAIGRTDGGVAPR